jgi:mono/diheme cytochrome c family protein
MPMTASAHRALRGAILATAAVAGLAGSRAARAEEANPAVLEQQFADTVRPFLGTHCVSCHGKEKPKAELDLTQYGSLDAVIRDDQRWAQVLEKVAADEMPPEKTKRRPAESERKAIVGWIGEVRRYQARKNAGDPGVVLARRLSNAEYDNTIRDLTGVDIRPTREFPVDPANEAGFDNSGESLAMSPALLKKYLEAARQVADHALLQPHGLAFAPFPVLADTDRDRYNVNRIIDFYHHQETDYARYFEAAWRFKHRAALGLSGATLASVAAQASVSAKYLATIWSTLETPQPVGPIARLQAMWRRLPAGSRSRPDAARGDCERMRDFVVELRKKLVPEVKNLMGGRMNNGSQPLLMWKNRQWAANRTRCDLGALQGPGAPKGEQAPVAAAEPARAERAVDEPRPADRPPEPAPVTRRDRELMVPAGQTERYQRAFETFCQVFPDAFYVSERGRTYADQEREKAKGRGGRLLNAGFHSMTGYFRDDGPLYDMLLDGEGQHALDQLWDDFFFTSSVAVRMHTSFLWFERSDSSFMMSPEFSFTRPEDKNCTDEPVLKRLAAAFDKKARDNGASETVLQAIREHFEITNRNVRWLEKTRLETVPVHLQAVQAFAERAFRRPLTAPEREGLVTFYQRLRKENGLEHEEAIRNTLASVLVSPHFLYRVDAAEAGEGVRPLPDQALASRLSYFLWASMPDQPLLDLAAAGKLHQPEVLVAQTRRMLADPRARGLATEFVGNWLDFRRFEQHNGVDRERFPGFDDGLRAAMFEEPIRFTLDVIQRDRSVLDLVYGKHTFVNAALARHYGMGKVAEGDQWVRVERADRYGRGGLLPMAVFLTANSPGLRTSPVKRGYWVVRRMLGEHIPPPPANVPELPHDEAQLGALTLRQVLERHRADKACAGCHARFDSFGLVFEGYGPVGERRARDLGGKPVDTRAVFPDGSEATGLEGLVRYLRARRENDFLDNLCRKLLAYGLGRTLILPDTGTIEQMRARLAADNGRFGALIETIVTSPQFLNRRGSVQVAQQSPRNEATTGIGQ